LLYREMGQTGDKVSILGYGCMRFPKKNGRIDEERTEKQVISAIGQGVNYFDTAFLYPNSEHVLGRILAKGYRNKVMIATKMPPIMVHSMKDMDSLLDTQLKRLQTDNIDYYLMHSLNSRDGWQRLKQLGVAEFIEKAKQAGKINRIGFSYHGDSNQFKDIIDDYPWDFCQIQYNYIDENTQAGKEGLLYAAAKGLGILIMQPLRGGLLARKMPPEVQDIFAGAAVKRTPAEWALRWIWNHPEVSVVLSGMNEESQIEENIRIANSAYAQSLSAGELKCISDAKELISKKLKVACNACGYCMPCPSGVNIPMCFGYYNDRYLYGKRTTSYLGMLAGMDGGTPSYASLCSDCGKCEKLCPQSLPVSEHLKGCCKGNGELLFQASCRFGKKLL
jgi:uncharacterized protein